VLLTFEGKKSLNQVKEIADSLGGTIPIYVQSKTGYARYLIHMDNPEKNQYNASDVIALGGADYLEAVSTTNDLDKTISEMEQWCDDNGVFSYASLCAFARKNRPNWTRALRYRCTVHMRAYLQSRQWEIKEGISYNWESLGDEEKADSDSNSPGGELGTSDDLEESV